jgi:hypothetical protein
MDKGLIEQLSLDVNTKGKGAIKLFAFNPKTRVLRKLIERENLVLYGGADILAKLLSGDPKYAINTMYLEFINLANPADPVPAPTFDRSGGVTYYTGLTGTQDFLRVPLVVTPIIDSSDTGLYAGNRVTFFGVSEGMSGFHGLPFNSAVNSAVYGAGLVAAPSITDQSNDVVFSRVYTGIDKVLKESGFEIGVTWTIQFN